MWRSSLEVSWPPAALFLAVQCRLAAVILTLSMAHLSPDSSPAAFSINAELLANLALVHRWLNQAALYRAFVCLQPAGFQEN